MENEFDFFNTLNFGTDFTKQGLGGYGTYTDQFNRIVTNTPDPVLIEPPTGIQTIPKLSIFDIKNEMLNNNSDDRSNNITSKASIPTQQGDYDIYGNKLDEAKNDTNIKNLVGMGLINQAVDYTKKNYGYMIMNAIFPGSGTVIKKVVDKKKQKELDKIETERQDTIDSLNKQKAIAKMLGDDARARDLQIQAASQTQEISISEATKQQDAIERDNRRDRQGTLGDRGGGDHDGGASAGAQSDDAAGMGGYNRGGRIRYGNGGIVTL